MNAPRTVDDYILQFTPELRAILEEVRAVIKASAPGATERMAYGMPTYTLKRNLIHFAAFKGHVGLYPTPSGVMAFAEELAPYARGKGSIRFPLDRPLPLDLIRRITLYRVAEEQR